MRMCAEEKISGYIAFHSLSTIWYVTRKATEEERRGYLKRICKILTISGADNESVIRAIENVNFKDFEDALQDCCADEADADYLITANAKDFSGHSIVRAIAPDEFITLAGKYPVNQNRK